MSEKLQKIGFLERGREVLITQLADKLEADYHISQRLGLMQGQAALFKLYLMGYLTLQTDTKTSYFLSRPETAMMARIAILRGFVSLAETREKNKHRISEHFFGNATTIGELMKAQAISEAYEIVAQEHALSVEYVKNNIPSDNPILLSIVDMILDKVGSPAAVKRAANLVCFCYVGVIGKSEVEQKNALNAVIEHIKIKEDQKNQSQ